VSIAVMKKNLKRMFWNKRDIPEILQLQIDNQV